MNPHTEDQDVIYNSSAYNPFPEPQTIPSGWDASVILSTPEVDPNALPQDWSETESN